MPKKKEITLVANMMVIPSEIPYLSHTLPALKDMCDRVVVMYQGPNWNGLDEIAEELGDNDTLIKFTHREEDYSKKRNIMLEHVDVGDWVLKWDPDELPTGNSNHGQLCGLLALKEYITKYVEGSYTSVGIPIYHLVDNHSCLAVEYGMHHIRAFKKTPELHWEGHVHEQPTPHGKYHAIPSTLGMGIIHLSYYSPARLKRKEQHYATIPGSGHGPGSLLHNIEVGLRPIPENMTFEASDEWLQMVKELA